MTTSTMFHTVRAATLVLAFTAIPVMAQDGSGATCDRAARGVLEKPLPAPGTEGWNDFMVLTSCGSRGATVIAGVLLSPIVRQETDPGRLDALAGMLDGWFAPALVTAYETVVSAREASPGMRLRTMWLLSGLLAPNTEVAGPLQGYTANSCSATERVTSLRGAPNSMPQQAYDDARLAYARAASDPSATDAVRGTARCWGDVVGGRMNAGAMTSAGGRPSGDRIENPSATVDPAVITAGPPPITVIEPIEVRYECDGRFVVLNQGPALMNLRYEIVGAGWGGMIQIGGRASHVFVAARMGPIRFLIGDREVAYVRYVRRACYEWRDGFTVVVASRMYFPPPYMTRRPTVVVPPRPVIEAAPRGGTEKPAKPGPSDKAPATTRDDQKGEGRSAHRRP